MHEKLKLLLEQIKMPNDFYQYFKDGNLDKIAVLKKENTVTFIVTLDKILPVEIYVKLCNLISEHFNMYKETKVIINVLSKDFALLMEYYNYLIEEYSIDYPLLQMFAGISNNFEDDTLHLEVSNKAEEMKLESIKERIISDLNSIGYSNINIKVSINEEARNAILKQIEEEKEKDQQVLKDEAEKKNAIIKGYPFDGEAKSIGDLNYEGNNIIIEAKIFGIETKETPKINIITLKVTDYTDSIFVKVFERDAEAYKKLVKGLKPGNWFKMRGRVQDDAYSKELVLMANDIICIKTKDGNKIVDDAEEKRIELHAHTKMSQMDGLADEVALVKQAMAFGHKGIAITDHNGCQAFPHVYSTVRDYNSKIENPEDKFKAIYGTELTMVDDEVYTIIRGNDSKLDENIYVVFDVETTGFNAGLSDQMIEIGAVKIKDGEITERFDELINPGYPIDPEITEVTSITNAMVAGKPNEEEVVKRFKDFIGDMPLVAHNAKFDISMLEMAYYKYNLGQLTNPVLDTLEISRTMDREHSKHGLSALVKRYAIPFDEDHHHRADYDAEGTGYIFCKMIKKMQMMGIETLNDVKKLCAPEETHKFAREYHVNILALNKIGLKNIFRIVSLANTTYISKIPKIPRKVIEENREGLLVGSGCYRSEAFYVASTRTDEVLEDVIKFYDYVEVQPPEVYEHLVWGHDIDNDKDIKKCINKIIRCTKKAGKLIVATGDVHHLSRDDKLYREFIVNQKVPGGGRHPLARTLDKFQKIPSQHFRTTKEMLNDFSF